MNRFARVFQVDPLHPGTAVQRQALVDSLTYDFGSRYDHLNLRLAQAVKAVRPFILLGFHPDMLHPALSSVAGINFNDKIDVSGIKWFAPHEMGHLVEHYLLTERDRQWFMAAVGMSDWGMRTQETFADAVRDWKNGTGWQTLDQVLLPAAS
jgi:hypothetical protein